MYDRTKTFSYNIPAADLHTADITRIIRGPSGQRVRLVDVLGAVTTTLAGATTKPIVKVGVSGTLGQSASWNLGAAASGAALVASAQAGTTALQRDANNGSLPVMPADTDIYITLVAATGSGAAGVADLIFVFEYGV